MTDSPATGRGRSTESAPPRDTDGGRGGPIVSSRVVQERLWRQLVSPVPAVLVFLLGSAATALVWILLRVYSESETRRDTLAVGEELAKLVEIRATQRLRELEHLAELWSRFDVSDGPTWSARAYVRTRHQAGLMALAWVEAMAATTDDPAHPGGADGGATTNGSTARPPADADGQDPAAGADDVDDASAPSVRETLASSLRRVPAEGREPDVLIEADDDTVAWLSDATPPEILAVCRAALTNYKLEASPIVEAPDGRRALAVAVPLDAEVGRGSLLAVIDVESFLEHLLGPAARGYRVAVADGGRTIFTGTSSPGPPTADEAARLGVPPPPEPVDMPVEVVPNRPWSLELSREPGSWEKREYVLRLAIAGTGMVLSVLLGAIVHLGQLARVRARATEHANRELQSEIHEARTAKDEILNLNRTLEARVDKRTEGLNEAIDELEAFNASVSHDLRSPLGAILNYAAILDEDYRDELGPEGHEILKRVEGSARLAVSLMDGLLAFSRVGRQDVSLDDVDMVECATSVFDELTANQAGPRARLVIDRLPHAWADAALIRLVWMNLISNALKFTREEERLVINIGFEARGEQTVYSVKDNGIGFRMRDAERIFGVFERLHPRTTFAGHGLGLAIVRRVVARHGGHVVARGSPGKGAAFYFTIPNREASDGQAS